MASALKGLHVVQRKLLLVIALLLLSSAQAVAWKVTVDSTKATGSGNYRTLNEFLDSLNNKKINLSGGTNEDTVLFSDPDQKTYELSSYATSQTAGSLRFIGQITDPDKFAVINHSAGSWYNLLDTINVAFERCIFTGITAFSTGSKAKRQYFKNCVIRNFTNGASAFLTIANTGGSRTVFENCLFHNNSFTRGIVDIETYGTPAPVVRFINCTIHNNEYVFNCKTDALRDSISVKNCIFSANNNIFYGSVDFKDKVTYSFVPNETFTGTGNIVGADPRYIVSSGKSKPSEWRPADSSAAKGLGDTTGAPKTDISGKVRADEPGKRDAGCWDILDAVKISAQPQSDTVGAGDTVLFIVKASGAPTVTYSWYKKGGADPVVQSDTLKIAGATLLLDSTLYYCIVANTINSVTSDTVTLRVFQKPAITDQPDTTVFYRGDPMAFSVAATGGALVYSWLCNDTVIPGATGTTLQLTSADSGNVYSCRVTNPLGSVTSQKALLRILSPDVHITSHSGDTTLMEGAKISLSITADGKAPITYSWHKAGSATELSGTASYQKSDVAFSDSGIYRCVVSNAATNDSVSIHIGIIQGVKARIVSQSGPVVAVKTGNPVTLSVTASGAEPLTYTWYRKKATSNDSVWQGAGYAIAAAQSSDSGYYFCVVKNDLGTDTTQLISLVVSSSQFFNPLVLGCTFVDPTHVMVNVQHFRDLPAVVGSGPYTDTIGLWYDALTIPSGVFTRTDANCIKLPLAAMTAASGDSYDTLVKLPGPAAECGIMSFTLTPLWKSPDTIVSAVASAQNATVFMCDSADLENPLVLTVNYTAVSDSILVTVSNLTSINRDSMLSLAVGYTLPGGQPVVASLSPAELPAGNVFSKVFHDAHFTEGEETLTVSVRWRGIGGNFSNAVTKKLVVGKPRPANSANLVIDSTTSTTAGIHWQFTGLTDFDSIRIVWSVQPLTPSTSISGPSYYTMMLGNSVRSVVVDKLLPSYTYSIGVQVVKASVYSLLTTNSIAACTTKTDSSLVVNSIIVKSAVFSSSTNTVSLVWAIDSARSKAGSVANLETGIMWAAGNPPDMLDKISRNDLVVITDCKDTTRATVDISKNIQFSATYHFALILRRKGSSSWAAATDSSRTTVSTGAASWQGVSYFSGNDSIVTAFNGTVVLGKAGDGVVTVSDTLTIFNADSLLTGFIPAVKNGFDFKHDVNSDPIRVGMLYDTSLLSGRPATDIRMYQYDTVKKQWLQLDGCSVDTVARKVSVVLRPYEFPLPFMLLVDTLSPVVTITSDTATAVSAGTEIRDTLTVSDNVANCTVALVYWGSDGVGGVTSTTVQCTSGVSTVVMKVPADSIVRDRSLKAELVISDGIHRNVCDVSRTVKRQVSDPVTLTGMKWTPVMTTSELDVDSIEKVLGELRTGNSWKYDSLQFRIFCWADTVTSGAGKQSWLEYRPVKSRLFSMTPSKVVWVKTRSDKQITSLGTGTTVNVKNPYRIELRAKEWTDVALPYKMDISLGDIFTASESGAEFRNKVLVYKWATVSETAQITAQPKYINNMPDFDLLSTVLTSGAESDGIASYSIYNDDTSSIELKIPAVPQQFSRYTAVSASGLQKRASGDDGWSVTIKAQAGETELTPVLFGSRKGITQRRFPLPPGFENKRLFLETADCKVPLGAVVNGSPENGTVLNVVFENNGSTGTHFNYDVSSSFNLPQQWKVAMYDPQTGTVATSGSGQVAVSAESRRYAVVLTGDSSFIVSQVTTLIPKLSLLSMYPNPCRGDMAIRFNLPPADIQQVRVALFDQLGRNVWSKTIGGKYLRSGYNVFHWNLRDGKGMCAGTYIVTLDARSASGKSMGRKQLRMIYLP